MNSEINFTGKRKVQIPVVKQIKIFANPKIYIAEKLKLAYQIKESGWIVYNADDPILSQSLADFPRSVLFSLTLNPNCCK